MRGIGARRVSLLVAPDTARPIHATPGGRHDAGAHLIATRKLVANRAWLNDVLARVPEPLRLAVQNNLSAQILQAELAPRRTQAPPWTIVAPRRRPLIRTRVDREVFIVVAPTSTVSGIGGGCTR